MSALAHDAVLVEELPDALFRLATRIELPGAPADVFPFFADAGNLEAITPPFLRFRILTPRPIAMQVGTVIDYRLHLRGMPLRWRTLITAWEPGVRFIDEQIRGPYAIWRHEHLFEPGADGTTTIVRDEVRYAMVGGRLANRLVVARDLRRIFAHRQERVRELLG